MGYLPRGLFDPACRADRVEGDLLRLDPAYLYLYYIGLGFFYGFRHPRQPQRLLRLQPHIRPVYFPLCYDGYGFKLGFFDFISDPSVTELLSACPRPVRPAAYQGFGRSMFFVFLEDEQPTRITVSAGVATYPSVTTIDSVDALIRAADQALYAAKDAGRDRVE